MEIDNYRREALTICVEMIREIINSDSELIKSMIGIKFRIKSKKSIIKKMQNLNLKLEDIYDLIGIRIIFDTIEEGSKFLKVIDTIKDFEIVSIRDYHKKPKVLMSYKAIHVLFKYKNYCGEIQITDAKSNEIAVITHNDYKEGKLTEGLFKEKYGFLYNDEVHNK